MTHIDDAVFEQYVDVSIDLIVSTAEVRKMRDALTTIMEATEEFKEMKLAADKQAEILARGEKLVHDNPELMELNAEDNFKVLDIAAERLGEEYAEQIERSRDGVKAEAAYAEEMDKKMAEVMKRMGLSAPTDADVIEEGSPAQSAELN